MWRWASPRPDGGAAWGRRFAIGADVNDFEATIIFSRVLTNRSLGLWALNRKGYVHLKVINL